MAVRIPIRAWIAHRLACTVASLSRVTGRGEGSAIGGRVGLLIDPNLLAHLARGRQTVLVSGTNGKTTTTELIAAALRLLGPVASNRLGANMPSGHTSALARARSAPYAVLEVDEHYLAQSIVATRPKTIMLLNLSRDQLDRTREVVMVARRWRAAIAEHAGVRVIANADDPLVAWAAEAAEAVTWFSAGARWTDDAWMCPGCGARIDRSDCDWRCTGCALARPAPHWMSAEGEAWDGSGASYDVRLGIPGRVNVANATAALAAASQFGLDPAAALRRIREVSSVAGRYAVLERDGRRIRLLLAKNPASWLETLEIVEPVPTLLSINARGPDGLDTSWLFDVDFAALPGRPLLITGDRAYDLAVRLEVGGVPFTHVRTLAAAVDAVPPGPLQVIANYTAFQDIRAELAHVR